MLIHMRANASRTSKGFSVDGTVSWDLEDTLTAEMLNKADYADADQVTDMLRMRITEHLSALMAGLDHRFPKEGEQQG